MINNRRFLLAMLVVAVAAVAVMPLLFGREDAVLEQRRNHVRAMTSSERERLDRNFERFTKLSETERHRFRELHAVLNEDQKHDHGRLNAALETYEQWLQTLPLYERDALEQINDPSAKIDAIRDVLDRQREDRIELRLGAQREGRLGTIPALRPDDLQSVLNVLEHTAESILPPAAVARQTEGYEGIARTLKLFEMLARQDQYLISLLTEDRLRRLMEAISDETARQDLETIPGRPQAPFAARRIKMVVTLWMNLDLAVQRETAKRKVTDQMLNDVLVDLPAAEQEELYELSPGLFRLELRTRLSDADSPRPIDRRLLRRFFRPSPDDRKASTDDKRSAARRLPRRRTSESNQPE